MGETYDDTSAAELLHAAWRKSTYSNPSGNCVQVARLPGGQVAVRNSRHPDGPVLICAPGEIAALIQGAKDGHFDHLLREAARVLSRWLPRWHTDVIARDRERE